jgi:hypothetical protein
MIDTKGLAMNSWNRRLGLGWRQLHGPLALAALLLVWTGSIGGLGAVQASDPVGVWRGEWTSGSTGHRGPMRVVVRPKSDGSYQARFTGRFLVVVPFAYKVDMHRSHDSHGHVQYVASKKLGPLLGSYTMNTMVSGSQWMGSFQAAGDRGNIRLHRVR